MINTQTGVQYDVYYQINDDGTIGPDKLYKSDLPEGLTFSEEQTSMPFIGEMVRLETTKDKVTTTTLGMLVYESPFLDKEEAVDKLKYPNTVLFTDAGGTTTPITKSDEIKEIVDQAMSNKRSGGQGKMINKSFHPYVTFKGVRGTIDYKTTKKEVKEREVYNKKTKKKEKKKFAYYRPINSTLIQVFPLVKEDNISDAAFDEAIESGTISKEHIKGLSTKKAKASNLTLANSNVEVIQEEKKTEEFLKELEETKDTSYCEEKFTGFTCARITANIFKHWNLSHNIIFPIAFAEDIENCPDSFKKKAQMPIGCYDL